MKTCLQSLIKPAIFEHDIIDEYTLSMECSFESNEVVKNAGCWQDLILYTNLTLPAYPKALHTLGMDHLSLEHGNWKQILL